MNHPIFKAIYASKDEHSWPLLQTSTGFYEFRMGGISLTDEKPNPEDLMDLPVTDVGIVRITTDDDAVYIELENGDLLYHSCTFVDDQGMLWPAIYHLNAEEFREAREEWYGIELPLVEIDL